MNGTLKSAALIALGACIAIAATALIRGSQPQNDAPKQDTPNEVREDPQAAAHLATLERQMQELKAENEQLMASLDTSEQMVTVLGQSIDDIVANAEDLEGKDEKKNPMAKMLETMGSEKMAKAQAGAMVQMGYSKLFDQLQLDAATKEQVREVLVAYSAEQFQGQFAMMSSEDKFNRDDFRQLEEERKAQLRDDLAQLFSRDQLETYDNYDVEREMMASGLDMQLSMYAGQLSPENRELARDVLVDELLAMQAEREASQHDEQTIRIGARAATTGLDNQIEAMQNAAERLAQLMDPEQFALFQDYVQQQTDMFEGVRGLVSAVEEEVEETQEGRRTRRIIVSIP